MVGTVAYTQLDDTDNAGSIVGELLRRAEQYRAEDGSRDRAG